MNFTVNSKLFSHKYYHLLCCCLYCCEHKQNFFLLLNLHRIGNINSNLELRATREKREWTEINKFGLTIIRIIFPYDRLILQSFFKPSDTIDVVAKVVKKYTKTDIIHLFTAPPKIILSNSATLAQLKLVPNGSIYCSSNDSNNHSTPLIQDKFSKRINSFSIASRIALNQMKSMFHNLK